MLFASKPQFLLLIFILTLCLCFAKQQQAGDPDNGWNAYWYGLGVSGTFGNGRNSIQADQLIKQMFDWGLPMNLVQFNTPEYRKSNQWYAPPISETNVNTPLDKFGKGTKYVILSWDDYMQSKQAQMNKGCGSSGTCTEDSVMFINWGILDKMNFDKDGILIWFSGLVDVSIDCDDFPSNCTAPQIHLVEDHTFTYDQKFVEKGLITNIGQVNSLDDINRVMKDFGKNTNQHLTLPDGSST